MRKVFKELRVTVTNKGYLFTQKHPDANVSLFGVQPGKTLRSKKWCSHCGECLVLGEAGTLTGVFLLSRAELEGLKSAWSRELRWTGVSEADVMPLFCSLHIRICNSSFNWMVFGELEGKVLGNKDGTIKKRFC